MKTYLLQFYVSTRFQSPAAVSYVSKTDCCLYTCLQEHATNPNSEIHNHINSCKYFQYIKSLLELSPYNNEVINTNITQFILKNCKITDKANHWSLLLFKGSLAIHQQKLELNHSAEALKDLVIFN